MTSDYSPGSIVKIKLRNFLVHSDIELHCHPALNLVVGPNGSGKSSFVCALCLGLAGKPETLLRSQKLSGFVKHGADKAFIEIELMGEQGELITIRRIITVENERSSWKLNGKLCPQTAIKEVLERLNIEVDNLCNFMPQERVHAFAQLTPNERLVETIATVGGMEMLQEYEELKEYRRKEWEIQGKLETCVGEVEQLKKQNDMVEQDVQRFMEREEIQKVIDLIERKKPWVEYNEARDDFKKAQDVKKQKQLELSQIVNEANPLQDELQEINVEMQKLKQEKDNMSRGHRQLVEMLSRHEDEISQTESSIDKHRQLLIQSHKEREKRINKIGSLQREYDELERGKHDNVATEIPQALEQALEAQSRRIRQINDERLKVEDEVNALESKLESINAQGLKCKRELDKINDLRHQREQLLQQFNRDMFNAYNWLCDNRQLFKHPVYVNIIEIAIRNQQFVDAISALIAPNILFAFVVQSREDYDTLMKECAERMRLRISAIQLDGPQHSIDDYPPPSSREDLRLLGFECFALDLVQAPGPVLTALCEHARLNQIPIAIKSVDDERAQRQGFHNYISGNNKCQWKVSKYGAKLASMKASKIRRSTWLAGTAIDEHEKQRLESAIHSLLSQKRQLEDEKSALVKKIARIDSELSQAQAEKQKLMEERRRIQQAIAAQKRLEFKMERLEAELESLRREANDLTEERQLKQKLGSECIKRAKIALEIQSIVLQMDFSERTFTLMKILRLQQKKTQLENSSKDALDAIDAARVAVANAVQRAQELKQRAAKLLEKAKRTGDLTETLINKFKEFPDAVDELNEMMASEQAKLDLSLGTDPHVVEQFNNRKRTISRKQAEIDNLNSTLTALTRDFQQLKTSWERRLKELIAQLSIYFGAYIAKLGCAGEVKINKLSHDANGKEDDYSKWGIEILVKFRDNEQLTALNAHRQSGGERSVTIVMYLMALQHFSKSPFRVVDEINQGMDPRNERLVHKQIVETICNSQQVQKQYFLITPKLLPGLMYHENMRVLTIYNGEWLPESKDWKSCRSETWVDSASLEVFGN